MDSYLERKEACFGASAAAVVLLCVLIGEIVDDLLITLILNSRWVEPLSFLRERGPNEIMATQRAFGGLVGHLLSFGITVAVLKAYLPRCSITELFHRFGWIRSKKQVLLVSFLGGISLVLLFNYVLMVIFPPPDFAAPHPANVVNYGSTVDKLAFVVGAVLVAPVTEEFLFRGVLYSGISATWNKWVAALLVTLCFICVHPEALSSGYWLTHTLLYITSCVLIIVREVTGALPAGVMFHIGVNFAAVLL